jgi:DNA primase
VEISKTDLSLVGLLQHYGFDLKESGDRFVCLCPFHNDKNTPNLTIYPKTNTYHCFTCKTTGDSLSLIAYMEKIPLSEVKKKLGTTFIRMKLSNTLIKKVDFYEDALLNVAKIFHLFLKEHPEHLDYCVQVMNTIDEELNNICISKIEVDFNLRNKILDKVIKMLYTDESN